MSNCPTRYYDNCLSNQLCSGCLVWGGNTLLYTPTTNIGPHPASIPLPTVDPKVLARRKRQGRRAQKLGYNAEKDIFTRLRGTHNPTSQGYDGTIAGYRVEYKVRLHGNSIMPTKAEWHKAQAQGNSLVIVEDKGTGDGTVTMSIDTFDSIREYLTL